MLPLLFVGPLITRILIFPGAGRYGVGAWPGAATLLSTRSVLRLLCGLCRDGVVANGGDSLHFRLLVLCGCFLARVFR